MGYMHIQNLYKDQTILLFRECYALEKIHGTSAHLKIHKRSDVEGAPFTVSPFSGGAKHSAFVDLFDIPDLIRRHAEAKYDAMTVFGEAYGGNMQGMSGTYGTRLRFIVFDVQIGEHWLDVPDAESVALALGLEFVHYSRVSTDLAALDAARDAFSAQARRNGVEGDKVMEGVVLRPTIELLMKNGSRIIAKHKRAEFGETKTAREVSPEKQSALEVADAIAVEWVTDTRLGHVLDKLAAALGVQESSLSMEHTPKVITAMQEDIRRESEGEVVWSKDAEKAIGKATAKLWKARVVGRLSLQPEER